MKIGIKIYEDVSKEHIKELSKHIDFIELYAGIDYEYDFLRDFDKPVVIHVAHYRKDKVNFVNPERESHNKKALKNAIRLADKFRSNKIIFHPQLSENENCTLDSLCSFIKHNYDKRLLLENMPSSSRGEDLLCRSYEDINKVLVATKVGFCLDIAHAYSYAIKEKKDGKELIKTFISLKPLHFHISDVSIPTGNDEHLHFGRGGIDIPMIKSIIPVDSDITIETDNEIEEQIKDIQILRKEL